MHACVVAGDSPGAPLKPGFGLGGFTRFRSDIFAAAREKF